MPGTACLENSGRNVDASFLLTVEVFLLKVRLFNLQWASRKQERPNLISGRGEP